MVAGNVINQELGGGIKGNVEALPAIEEEEKKKQKRGFNMSHLHFLFLVHLWRGNATYTKQKTIIAESKNEQERLQCTKLFELETKTAVSVSMVIQLTVSQRKMNAFD